MRDTLIKVRGNRTQMKVSVEMGISQKYLSKLELGQRTPSLKTAIKISSYYKTSVEKLFPDIYGNKECNLVDGVTIPLKDQKSQKKEKL